MFGVICVIALAFSQVFAQGPNPYPWGPRKEEFMLPMRDGVKLHTLIFFPKDGKEGGPYPTIVDRSPYGYGDMEWITDVFLPFGFVAVGQDMRGTELSEGNFTMWQGDTEDSNDLGNWIVKQPWSNGVVYTFGASADGIGELQTPAGHPSWLAAQYIAWAPNAMYDILFPFGNYKQETTEDWLFGLTMPNPDVVYDNIKTIYENEAHSDFWNKIELTPANGKFADVKFPSAFWAGWYDVFIQGTLTCFDGYNRLSDESVRYTSKITIDPCGHCLETQEFFTEDVVMGRTALVLAQLFELYGIVDVRRSEIKNVTFYVMSSNDDAGKQAGQYWTSLEEFPRARMTEYYFHKDGSSSTEKESADNSISYVFDPANPQLTMGGSNLPDSIGGSIPCGPLDQSEVDKRADVLNFQTEVFDEPFAMTGPMFATLFVSSDAIDTDFMVRISDVYPTGEVLLIQDNAVRMRWRNGGLQPEYLVKGEVYEVTLDVWNTSFIIAPGHALRFSVSSSNNPRFSVNPQNGLLLNDPAYPGENVIATNTLFVGPNYPSRVTLPVVSKAQLPNVHVVRSVQHTYPEITDDLITRMSGHIEKMINRMN